MGWSLMAYLALDGMDGLATDLLDTDGMLKDGLLTVGMLGKSRHCVIGADKRIDAIDSATDKAVDDFDNAADDIDDTRCHLAYDLKRTA
jgi:hypothetical protein